MAQQLVMTIPACLVSAAAAKRLKIELLGFLFISTWPFLSTILIPYRTGLWMPGNAWRGIVGLSALPGWIIPLIVAGIVCSCVSFADKAMKRSSRKDEFPKCAEENGTGTSKGDGG